MAPEKGRGEPPHLSAKGVRIWKSPQGQSLLRKMFSGRSIEPQLTDEDRQTLAALKAAPAVSESEPFQPVLEDVTKR
ncbi:MAG: hypothetical protein ACFWTZ_03310 [Burkholderia sp.]|jgi:hypothetical protein